MAKGFGTGLIHGGLASAAALLVLSLAVPVPRQERPDVAPDSDVAEGVPAAADTVAAPETADTAEADTAEGAILPAGGDDLAAPDDAATSPRADAVSLPIGSEFGRGVDLAPPVPVIPQPPQAGAGLSEAPAVVAPAAEPEPVASADPVVMRDPVAGPAAGDGLTAPETEEAPQLVGFEAPRAPSITAGPAGLSQIAAPDDAPPTPTPAAPVIGQVADDDAAGQTPEPVTQAERPAPEPEAEAQAQPKPVPQTQPQPKPEPAAEPQPEPAPQPSADQAADRSASDTASRETPPALAPAPAIDLSTPPDLTDLRTLDRN